MRESANKLHILVAEDDAVSQRLMVCLLERMGHACVIAANGKEAVALACSQNFDLVFMDVEMPEMDGLAATTAIREHEKKTRARVPIFALTAQSINGNRECCLAAGMDGHLSKPVRFGDIEKTLAGRVGAAAPSPPCAVSEPPAWNREQILDRLGGDEELLQELSHIFLQESPKLLQKLRRGMADGDPNAVQQAAHSLKGEVGYMGAPGASQACRRLEEMGRERDLSQGPEVLAVLEQELAALYFALQDPAGALQ